MPAQNSRITFVDGSHLDVDASLNEAVKALTTTPINEDGAATYLHEVGGDQIYWINSANVLHVQTLPAPEPPRASSRDW